jgi:hypothetical protein
MRCKACDCLLSDFESTRKYSDMTYVDLCTKCFQASDYENPVLERADLFSPEEEIYIEDFLDE